MEGFKYNTLNLEWRLDSKMPFFSCALYHNRHYMNSVIAINFSVIKVVN